MLLLASCSLQPNNEKKTKEKKGAEARKASTVPGKNHRRFNRKSGQRTRRDIKPEGLDLEAELAKLKVAKPPKGKKLTIIYAGGIRGEIDPCG